MDRVKATVQPSEAGLRLDLWLSRQIETLSRSRAKALVRGGAATIDGVTETDPRRAVSPGNVCILTLPPPTPAIPEPEDIPLDILHEDEHLIVVNKVAGMSVHPAPGTWSGTLVNALLHHCKGQLPGIGGVERPGIVHRIDKLTTGVLVVAKTEAAHAGLSQYFAEHTIERTYLALTRGAPRPLAGTVDAPIGRATGDRKKMSVVKTTETRTGRRAITHYVAMETFGLLDKGASLPAAALIHCRLETGRTHQIRVHMGHIGAPLIGDPIYSRARGIKAFGHGPAFDRATQLARKMTRQALHAAVLGFDHPVTGRAFRFEASLPDDMAQLLATLRAMPDREHQA